LLAGGNNAEEVVRLENAAARALKKLGAGQRGGKAKRTLADYVREKVDATKATSAT
jgi:hypothetical protein